MSFELPITTSWDSCWNLNLETSLIIEYDLMKFLVKCSKRVTHKLIGLDSMNIISKWKCTREERERDASPLNIDWVYIKTRHGVYRARLWIECSCASCLLHIKSKCQLLLGLR
jgi:hypothetical protein